MQRDPRFYPNLNRKSREFTAKEVEKMRNACVRDKDVAVSDAIVHLQHDLKKSQRGAQCLQHNIVKSEVPLTLTLSLIVTGISTLTLTHPLILNLRFTLTLRQIPYLSPNPNPKHYSKPTFTLTLTLP